MHMHKAKDRQDREGDKVLITCKVCIALTESNNKNRATATAINSDCAYIEKRIFYTEIKTFNLFIKLNFFSLTHPNSHLDRFQSNDFLIDVQTTASPH